ncbi:reverse transcriptase domain-containing protein [Tanacetum coccineum]
MIDQGVTAALTARDANRNGDDSHTSGTGARRTERVTRECTYQDFMKCQPLYFKGTEGVVELTQWFERMETVFRISNCSVENQIKFSTCTLLAGALTWWNSHVRIVGHDVAYAMTWIDLRKKMTNKSTVPRNELKKLEIEVVNLKSKKGTDVTGYNQRFQELALLCVRMFPEESDKVERYVGGLPDMIHGSVVASKPKTMQEATEMATELMDKKISTFAERQAENKRKLDNNHQAQQQLPKRQNVVQAYAAVTGHYKSDCPKLKNQNHGTSESGKEHMNGALLRRRETDQTLTTLKMRLKFKREGWSRFAYNPKLDPLLTKLEFPQELSKVHNMFHVSNLKKCYADEPLAVLLDGLHLDDKLHFVEEPLEIVGREVKRLKRSRIPLVKVRWNSKRGPEFTWEREDQFKKKYPHLFTKTTPSSSAAS